MSSLLNIYNRKKISFIKGNGSYLYASNGQKYLDFVQGIAVNCLGHANKYLIRSISKQSKTVACSNVFTHLSKRNQPRDQQVKLSQSMQFFKIQVRKLRQL